MYFLYRHYNKRGALLYVGISLSPILRLAAHRVSSKWFRQISTIKIEEFKAESTARKAEIHAIKTERPLHNLKHIVPIKRAKFSNNLPNLLGEFVDYWRVRDAERYFQ